MLHTSVVNARTAPGKRALYNRGTMRRARTLFMLFPAQPCDVQIARGKRGGNSHLLEERIYELYASIISWEHQ
jgi:hypothetical protein